MSKKENKRIILDINIPGGSRVHEKELEKIEKYQDLTWEIRLMWSVKIIPVVVGALGSVTKKLGQWIEKLGIRVRIGLLQKTTPLGTARILRKVIDL